MEEKVHLVKNNAKSIRTIFLKHSEIREIQLNIFLLVPERAGNVLRGLYTDFEGFPAFVLDW